MTEPAQPPAGPLQLAAGLAVVASIAAITALGVARAPLLAFVAPATILVVGLRDDTPIGSDPFKDDPIEQFLRLLKALANLLLAPIRGPQTIYRGCRRHPIVVLVSATLWTAAMIALYVAVPALRTWP